MSKQNHWQVLVNAGMSPKMLWCVIFDMLVLGSPLVSQLYCKEKSAYVNQSLLWNLTNRVYYLEIENLSAKV